MTDNLNDRISILRKKRKLTQSELANRADVSVVSISNYERGIRTPDSKTLSKIAKALNSPLWLLSDGLPDPNDKTYNYDYFLDADDNDMQKYYMEKQAEANGDFFSRIEDKGNFLKQYINDIEQLQFVDDLARLANIVQYEKSNITNRERLEQLRKSPGNTDAINYDPFKKIHETNEELRKKNYKLYFLSPTTKNLVSLIREIDDGKTEISKEQLIERLQSILDQAYKEIVSNHLV